MLVDRVIWQVKKGCMQEFREALAAEIEQMNAPHAVRTLVAAYGGCHDVVVSEIEFVDIREFDEFYADWRTPRGVAFWNSVNPLLEGSSTEIWRVVD